MTDTDPSEDFELHLRWQEPPTEWHTPDRLEKRRLAAAMRSVIEQLDATAAPVDAIADAADELERVAERFARTPRETAYEGYRETANVGGDLHASFDRSPIIGHANPLAPPLLLVQNGDIVEGEVAFGSAYEGPPGCVHGGFIAATFDELLGATQSLSGAPGMTSRLIVNFRKPTPLHTLLKLEGRITSIDGRKITANGELRSGDTLCAEAEGLFISIDSSVFAALMQERERARSERT